MKCFHTFYACAVHFLNYILSTIFKIIILQHEAKMKTLNATMKEMEAKKRVLEEAVDSLNEEMSEVRAEGMIRR